MKLWINENLNELLIVVLIFSIGFLLGLFGLERANFRVFDEVYFITQAQNYLKKEEFFDGHPPLAKLFFALLLKISGWPERENYFLPRILFLIFSSFLGVLGFILIKEVSNNLNWATIVGILLNTETSLLFFRKFLLLEIVWINFSLLCLIFLFKNKKLLFFIFWALAISTKWFSIIFVILFFVYFLKNFEIKEVIFGLILIILIYYLFFEIHFGFFIKERGFKFLTLSFKKILEENLKMFFSHSVPVEFCSPLASFVLGWPLGIRNINATFEIFPNILVWIFSFLYTLKVIFETFKKKIVFPNEIYLFTAGYLFYFFNLILIESLRPGYLYYYFGALIFGIFILSYFTQKKPYLLILFILFSLIILPKVSGAEIFGFEKLIFEALLKYMNYGEILFRNLGIILGFGWF
jgi:predicted membrane-bound dolichyl-phosphate-mannose-protein mannosyltransferase